METQLRKRMQQVKELFTDCTDVFEELVAVKTHLAEKIEECQSAVENIQSSLSKVDVSQPKVEDQIQVQDCFYLYMLSYHHTWTVVTPLSSLSSSPGSV